MQIIGKDRYGTNSNREYCGDCVQVFRFFASLACALVVSVIASAAPAGAAKIKDVIGVSIPTEEGGFYTAMLYGIETEARKHDYQVDVLSANGFNNAAAQVSQIQSLLARGVGILLVNSIDPTVTQRIIRQALANGVTVIGAGNPLVPASGYASASHCVVGKDMARGAKALLPHGGTIGVLAGPAGAFWSTERLTCFKKAIAGSRIRIVAEKTSEASIASGLTIASDFLSRFPKLDLIYGADNTVGNGAARAVQVAGRCGKTKVLTAVFDQQSQQLMRQGCLNYDVALQPVAIGERAVAIGIAIHSGHPPQAVKVLVPNLAVTPRNMRDVVQHATSTISAPAGWKPSL